jgi:uroporphyrinogen-III synthase
LKQALKETGATPISLPMVETTIPEENPQLEFLLRNPEQYNWIAFSSRKAIQAFAQYKERFKIQDQAINNIHFCAIGKDAEYLENRLGISPAFTPAEPSPSGIVETLKQLEGTSGQKIAVLAPKVEGLSEPNIVPDFITQLTNIGMIVQRINAYTTHPARIHNANEWLQSIGSGEYDVIAFTSSAEVEAFLHFTQGKPLPPSQIFACFGPYTSANAQKMGLNIEIVASNFHSFQGFAKEIESYFHNN